MVLHPALRGTIAGLAAISLIYLGYEGITSAVSQWPDSTTPWERVQSASQLVYGAAGILALITAFRFRQFRKYAELSFALGASAAGGLATVVWGGKSILLGVLTGIASVAVAGIIVWMLRVGVPATQSTPRT